MADFRAAKARLGALVLNQKADLLEGKAAPGGVAGAQNKFDVLALHAQRKRRQPLIETLTEEKILRLYDRLRGINLCRDLERNFTAAKAMLNQRKLNVVGNGPKLRMHTGSPEANERIASWFNTSWAKNCDFRGDLQDDGSVAGGMHLAEHVQLALAALTREGDTLCVFDDGLIENTGKILWFEADQFPRLSDLETAAPKPWNSYRQESGVLFDRWGRVAAYVAHSGHGKSEVNYDPENVMIVPASKGRFLKRVWRFNQLRGTAEMLTTAADLQDMYELRSSEIQTGKVGSKFAGVVKKESAADEMQFRREQTAEAQYDPTLAQPADGLPNTGVSYDRLEALTGGFMEYMEPGDEFKLLDFNRPTINFIESVNAILRGAGAAMGLSKTYTTLNTESSYTAFRGDMLLSWAQFYADQKFLERHLMDWLACRAIKWAAASGQLGVELPEGWESAMSWAWPQMPAVDPLKESMAHANDIKHAFASYSEILGPDWKKTIHQLAEEIREIKDQQLPAMAFENQKDGLRFTNSANGRDLEN